MTQWLTSIDQVAPALATIPQSGYSIYKIEFKHGAEYVGMTEQCVADRIEQHAKRQGSEKVYRRLCTGLPFRIAILATGLKEIQATVLENKYIRALNSPLNETPNTAAWDDPFERGK